MDLINGIIPVYPGMLVEVVEGVALDNTYMDGLAEITIDNKMQGEYMNICRVMRTPDWWPSDVLINAEDGDFIGVWATAIKAFKLAEYGNIAIVRNPDVFVVIDPNSELYEKVEEKYLNAKAVDSEV